MKFVGDLFGAGSVTCSCSNYSAGESTHVFDHIKREGHRRADAASICEEV